MRRIISNLLFAVLAVNGLACACPVDSTVPTESHHEKHTEIDLGSTDCHGDDCDGDCGSLNSNQSNRSYEAITNTLPQLEDDWQSAIVTALPPGSTWPSGPPSWFVQPNSDQHGKHSSPVSLKDRMLD